MHSETLRGTESPKKTIFDSGGLESRGKPEGKDKKRQYLIAVSLSGYSESRGETQKGKPKKDNI